MALAASVLWQHRAALLHDLQAGAACASWRQAALALPGMPLPPPQALAAVDALLARLRAAAGEAAWQKNADAVQRAFEAAEGEAGLLGRLFPSLSLVMCVATGAMVLLGQSRGGLPPPHLACPCRRAAQAGHPWQPSCLARLHISS